MITHEPALPYNSLYDNIIWFNCLGKQQSQQLKQVQQAQLNVLRPVLFTKYLNPTPLQNITFTY